MGARGRRADAARAGAGQGARAAAGARGLQSELFPGHVRTGAGVLAIGAAVYNPAFQVNSPSGGRRIRFATAAALGMAVLGLPWATRAQTQAPAPAGLPPLSPDGGLPPIPSQSPR